MESTHDEGAQVPPPAPLHAGRAQQSAQGWAGPWPAGQRWGGGQRRGRPPPPFSLPATEAANHQAGARPRRGLLWPRNSQTPSFRGKKIRAAGSAAGSGGRPGARDRTHVCAGSWPHTRLLCHPQKTSTRVPPLPALPHGCWSLSSSCPVFMARVVSEMICFIDSFLAGLPR